MTTELDRPYSPLWRGKYPHMLPADYDVWGRFLDKYAPVIKAIYYDVRLGKAATGATDLEPWIAKMGRAVTAKRLDALVEFEHEVWLVEVATDPGLRAVGQLATYVALYAQDPKIPKLTIPVLVCDWLDEDLRAALILYSMRALEV